MKNEKIILFVLAMVQFTNVLDFVIVMPLNPILSKLFVLTPQQFGVLVSSYTFSAGLSGFLSAFFADKFDRKLMLNVMYAGFTVGTLACALSPSYEILLVARSFTGIFGGVLAATVFSIVGDIIPLERRGAAMGIIMSSFALATVVGVPFGLYLATKFTWAAPFYFLVVMGVVITALIFFHVPSVTKHIQAQHATPAQVLTTIAQDTNQLKALCFTFILFFSQFSVIPFLSDYMVSNIGLTQAQLPLIYLTGGGASIIVSPFIGKLVDRYGRFRIFSIFAVLIILPITIITHAGQTPLYITLLVTVIFFIFNSGRTIPAMTMTTSAVPQQTRGSFMSINSAVQNMSIALAAYIAGLIIYKDTTGTIFKYNYVGYLSIALNCVAIFIAMRIKAVDSTSESVKKDS